MEGERDLNQDGRRVSEMGITKETLLLVLTPNRLPSGFVASAAAAPGNFNLGQQPL